VIVYNEEGTLRLNAAKILAAWLPDMAAFAQQYDTLNDRITTSLGNLNTTADGGGRRLNTHRRSKESPVGRHRQPRSSLLQPSKLRWRRYKTVSASIKDLSEWIERHVKPVRFAGLAQEHSVDLGGTPADLFGAETPGQGTIQLHAQCSGCNRHQVIDIQVEPDKRGFPAWRRIMPLWIIPVLELRVFYAPDNGYACFWLRQYSATVILPAFCNSAREVKVVECRKPSRGSLSCLREGLRRRGPTGGAAAQRGLLFPPVQRCRGTEVPCS